MISLVANTAVGSLCVAEPIKKPHTTRQIRLQMRYDYYIGGGAIRWSRCTLTIEDSIMSDTQTVDKSQYVCDVSLALTFDDKSIVRQSCRDKIRDLCERVSKVKEIDKDREAMFINEIGRLTYFLEMLWSQIRPQLRPNLSHTIGQTNEH